MFTSLRVLMMMERSIVEFFLSTAKIIENTGGRGGAIYAMSHNLYITRFQPVVKTLVNETIGGTINGI